MARLAGQARLRVHVAVEQLLRRGGRSLRERPGGRARARGDQYGYHKGGAWRRHADVASSARTVIATMKISATVASPLITLRERGVLRSRNGSRIRCDDADAHGHEHEQFPADAEDGGRRVLQRLKHPQKVPLRPDAGGRGGERVSLPAELPGQERREPGQQRKRDGPSEQVAQREMRRERHARPRLSGLLHARFVARRHAHAVVLHEHQVQSRGVPS